MIRFTKEMHCFSLLSGFLVYLILLILFLIAAFVIYRRKHLNLFKKRFFLYALLGGLFLLPAFSWLGWRFYSLYIIRSCVKALDNCDSVKVTIPTGAIKTIALSSDYNGDVEKIACDRKTEFRTELIITNKTVIKSLLDLIKQAHYRVAAPGSCYITWWGTGFEVFNNNKQICAFAVFAKDNLLLGKYGSFFSSENLQKEFYRRLPEMRSLVLRAECAANLVNIGLDLSYYHSTFMKKWSNTSFDVVRSYPDPNYWNDLLLAYYVKTKTAYPYQVNTEDDVTMQGIPAGFMCNNNGEGLCNYAMNPNCTPESPKNVVLLFEADSGWNQHGGPELMTFDHHQPRGCNVLFNDGTVRFITPEKAGVLNWGVDATSLAPTN